MKSEKKEFFIGDFVAAEGREEGMCITGKYKGQYRCHYVNSNGEKCEDVFPADKLTRITLYFRLPGREGLK